MKHFRICLVCIIGMTLCTIVYAADNKMDVIKELPRAAVPTTQSTTPPLRTPMPRPYAAPKLSIVNGTVAKLENADPANARLEVRDDIDGSTKTFKVQQRTAITKVSELSDLKPGDQVRIMAREADGNQIALNIIFGKIKNIVAPPATRLSAPEATISTPPQKPEEKR